MNNHLSELLMNLPNLSEADWDAILAEAERLHKTASPNWQARSQVNSADATVENYVLTGDRQRMFGSHGDVAFAVASHTLIPPLVRRVRELTTAARIAQA